MKRYALWGLIMTVLALISLGIELWTNKTIQATWPLLILSTIYNIASDMSIKHTESMDSLRKLTLQSLDIQARSSELSLEMIGEMLETAKKVRKT